MSNQDAETEKSRLDGNAPLAGVRVLEFGHFAAGPYATMLLADWGADVVKVEPPKGEPMRHWPPLVGDNPDDAFGMNFAALNRNKRFVEIDLTDTAGRRRATQLCKKAHIILENFRPGVLARLGFGYGDVVKINPSIVYCSLTGYGQTGPYRDRGAFDVAIQAASGIMSVTGDEDGPPAKCGVAIADYGTGVFAALSCIAALRRSERTGEPGYLDVSMFSCMLSLANLQTSEYWGGRSIPKRLGTRHPKASPYQAFVGSDGIWFILAAGSDRLWERVCEVIDRPELIDDPKFKTAGARAQNQKGLATILAAIFAACPAEKWLNRFDAAKVPTARIDNYADILASQHVSQIGLVHEMGLPGGGHVPTIGNPVRLSGYDFEIFEDPGDVGSHDSEVDAEWIAGVDG